MSRTFQRKQEVQQDMDGFEENVVDGEIREVHNQSPEACICDAMNKKYSFRF